LSPAYENEINFYSHQLGSENREPIELAISIAILKDNISFLDVSQVMQSLSESVEIVFRTSSRATLKYPDPWDFVLLLRISQTERSES